MRLPLWLCCLATAATAWAASLPARACSCVPGLQAVVPEDGASGVPTNAEVLLVFSGGDEGPVTLVDTSTGEVVESEVEDSWEGEVLVRRVRPMEELATATVYLVDGYAGYGSVALPTTFTTGSGPDSSAPGGTFLCKVLQGGASRELVARLNRSFAKVRHVKPKASRAESAEMYVVATGFRGVESAA